MDGESEDQVEITLDRLLGVVRDSVFQRAGCKTLKSNGHLLCAAQTYTVVILGLCGSPNCNLF